VIITDASPIAWGATFQVVEQNIKVNQRKQIKKLFPKKKKSTIL
jgi:hypothetical protein